MIVHVEVTREDIENGNYGCSRCPVALAIRRAIPGSIPLVTRTNFTLMGASGKKYQTPPGMRDFILEFDNQLPVEPITFDLEVPDGPFA